MVGSNNTSAENSLGRDTAACTLEWNKFDVEKELHTLLQATTTEGMADGDNGPVGEAILSARSRNLLRHERKMHWEFISWVSNGIGEVIGQKVDQVAGIVQQSVYVRSGRRQPIPIGLEKVLTECAQIFLVYQC